MLTKSKVGKKRKRTPVAKKKIEYTCVSVLILSIWLPKYLIVFRLDALANAYSPIVVSVSGILIY